MNTNFFSKSVINLALILLILGTPCYGQWTLVRGTDSALPLTLLRNTRLGLFAITSPQRQLFRSTDAGNTWQAAYWANMPGIPFPTSTNSTISLSTITSTTKNVFVIDWRTQLVFSSSDSGKTWDVLRDQTRPPFGVLAEDIVAIDSTVIRLYQGSLFFSSDNGISWRYNQELGRLASVRQVIVVDNTLIATSTFGEVFQSKDLGASWRKLSLTLNERTFIHFAGSALLLRQDINTFAFSSDSGKSWQPLQVFDSTNVIYQITFIDKKLLVASLGGLFSSSDIGKSWRKESGRNGLVSGYTTSLDTAGGQIFVSVVNNLGNGIGLYRTTPTTVSTRQEPSAQIFRSAPNPSTDYTDLAFTLPRAAQAGVTLYSTLGTEVWRSESATMSAGEQHIRIDTRHLPTGVYAYRLMVDGVSSVGRVVVVR